MDTALLKAKFAIITGTRQWQRCAFENTALLNDCVQLGWESSKSERDLQLSMMPIIWLLLREFSCIAGILLLRKSLGIVQDLAGAGLIFDRFCRLYHSKPSLHKIERLLWGNFDPLHPKRDLNEINIIGLDTPSSSGDFTSVTPEAGNFIPRALAWDDRDHLFVLDSSNSKIYIFDMLLQRLVRSSAVPPGAVDIAWHKGWLYGLSTEPGQLWRLSATRTLNILTQVAVEDTQPAQFEVFKPINGIEGELNPSSSTVFSIPEISNIPARLCLADNGCLFVLTKAHQSGAQILKLGSPGGWHRPQEVALGSLPNPIAYGSDIECLVSQGQSLLVVARRPNEDFIVIDLESSTYSLKEPLTAKSYDGMGIVATPDGRIAYWTDKGLRHAVAARLRYQRSGKVISYRLDSQRYLTTWGRILIDACMPAGTSIRVHCITSDGEERGKRVRRTPPTNFTLAPILKKEEETPLPPTYLMPNDKHSGLNLFRRSEGSEQPWLLSQDEFITLEAPVNAAPGRYLWFICTLQGTTRKTPKIRTVRVEYPGHDWLQRLPKLYSRNEEMRIFLQRYLAPMAGFMDELAETSTTRHALLKPHSTPVVTLPWLANWVGLTLDERWSESAKRTFLQEAVTLFRMRGTLWSLQRMLEIVTGVPIIIIEKFRMRGYGRVGEESQGWHNPAILGGGMRVGGPVGAAQATGSSEAIEDSFENHAHQFTVMILMELSDEMTAIIQHLLDLHRPAHTLVDFCGVGAGMRIGRGLHVELTSIVGRSGEFKQIQLGNSTLGRDRIIGRPSGAIKPGASRLGRDSRLK